MSNSRTTTTKPEVFSTKGTKANQLIIKLHKEGDEFFILKESFLQNGYGEKC